MTYLILKTIHILSAFILFGTGLGSAWYKWMADRSGNLSHIAKTNQQVVLADWIFTTPTILIQPITGILLAYLAGWSLLSPWILISIILYLLAGACWLPVVVLQIKMTKLSADALANNQPLTTKYAKLARIWFLLGIPAFSAMICVVILMVFKQIGGF
jgi:uncharacterized membrane protein